MLTVYYYTVCFILYFIFQEAMDDHHSYRYSHGESYSEADTHLAPGAQSYQSRSARTYQDYGREDDASHQETWGDDESFQDSYSQENTGQYNRWDDGQTLTDSQEDYTEKRTVRIQPAGNTKIGARKAAGDFADQSAESDYDTWRKPPTGVIEGTDPIVETRRVRLGAHATAPTGLGGNTWEDTYSSKHESFGRDTSPGDRSLAGRGANVPRLFPCFSEDKDEPQREPSMALSVRTPSDPQRQPMRTFGSSQTSSSFPNYDEEASTGLGGNVEPADGFWGRPISKDKRSLGIEGRASNEAGRMFEERPSRNVYDSHYQEEESFSEDRGHLDRGSWQSVEDGSGNWDRPSRASPLDQPDRGRKHDYSELQQSQDFVKALMDLKPILKQAGGESNFGQSRDFSGGRNLRDNATQGLKPKLNDERLGGGSGQSYSGFENTEADYFENPPESRPGFRLPQANSNLFDAKEEELIPGLNYGRKSVDDDSRNFNPEGMAFGNDRYANEDDKGAEFKQFGVYDTDRARDQYGNSEARDTGYWSGVSGYDTSAMDTSEQLDQRNTLSSEYVEHVKKDRLAEQFRGLKGRSVSEDRYGQSLDSSEERHEQFGSRSHFQKELGQRDTRESAPFGNEEEFGTMHTEEFKPEVLQRDYQHGFGEKNTFRSGFGQSRLPEQPSSGYRGPDTQDHDHGDDYEGFDIGEDEPVYSSFPQTGFEKTGRGSSSTQHRNAESVERALGPSRIADDLRAKSVQQGNNDGHSAAKRERGSAMEGFAHDSVSDRCQDEYSQERTMMGQQWYSHWDEHDQPRGFEEEGRDQQGQFDKLTNPNAFPDKPLVAQRDDFLGQGSHTDRQQRKRVISPNYGSEDFHYAGGDKRPKGSSLGSVPRDSQHFQEPYHHHDHGEGRWGSGDPEDPGERYNEPEDSWQEVGRQKAPQMMERFQTKTPKAQPDFPRIGSPPDTSLPCIPGLDLVKNTPEMSSSVSTHRSRWPPDTYPQQGQHYWGDDYPTNQEEQEESEQFGGRGRSEQYDEQSDLFEHRPRQTSPDIITHSRQAARDTEQGVRHSSYGVTPFRSEHKVPVSHPGSGIPPSSLSEYAAPPPSHPRYARPPAALPSTNIPRSESGHGTLPPDPALAIPSQRGHGLLPSHPQHATTGSRPGSGIPPLSEAKYDRPPPSISKPNIPSTDSRRGLMPSHTDHAMAESRPGPTILTPSQPQYDKPSPSLSKLNNPPSYPIPGIPAPSHTKYNVPPSAVSNSNIIPASQGGPGIRPSQPSHVLPPSRPEDARLKSQPHADRTSPSLGKSSQWQERTSPGSSEKPAPDPTSQLNTFLTDIGIPTSKTDPGDKVQPKAPVEKDEPESEPSLGFEWTQPLLQKQQVNSILSVQKKDYKSESSLSMAEITDTRKQVRTYRHVIMVITVLVYHIKHWYQYLTLLLACHTCTCLSLL